MTGYLADQEARLAASTIASGVLLLLVPESRVAEAQLKLEKAVHGQSQMTAATTVTPLVMTWGEWLDVWDEATQQLTSRADSLVADLVQLRALCEALVGW